MLTWPTIAEVSVGTSRGLMKNSELELDFHFLFFNWYCIYIFFHSAFMIFFRFRSLWTEWRTSDWLRWFQSHLKGYKRRRFQNILIPKPLNRSIASESRTTYVSALKTTLRCSVPATGRVDLCSTVLVWLGLGHDRDLALKKPKTTYAMYSI